MVMNPRTHPRGAAPDFTLPKPNPNPSRQTDALWWLVCMREALEPADSENGGTFAKKAGSHNAGELLPDHGVGNSRTDHSIRDPFNRTGPWWKEFTSAHDWTFWSAQKGDFRTISLYTKRLINAMRDPKDTRPDDVYFYTLGQSDNDMVVEGYNERDDEDETSGDKTHTWHRHDSFRRNIIGSFAHMWKALTIDMGWTYAEWLKSVTPVVKPKPPAPGGGGGGPLPTPTGRKLVKIDGELPLLKFGDDEDKVPGATNWISRAQAILIWLAATDIGKIDGHYGPKMRAAVKEIMRDDPNRSSKDGSVIGLPEWKRLYGLW